MLRIPFFPFLFRSFSSPVAKSGKSDPVRYIPFADPKPNRRIGMLYRKGSYREPAYRAIQDRIKQGLPERVLLLD